LIEATDSDSPSCVLNRRRIGTLGNAQNNWKNNTQRENFDCSRGDSNMNLEQAEDVEEELRRNRLIVSWRVCSAGNRK
jgi:hypothetical protein